MSKTKLFCVTVTRASRATRGEGMVWMAVGALRGRNRLLQPACLSRSDQPSTVSDDL